jgi:hypothetical protein
VEHNQVLKLVYTFFVGLLLAIFVGVGVNTFYEPPKAPDYSNFGQYRDEGPTDEQIAEQDRAWKEYEESSQPYSRNVSIITLVAAVALLAISLAFEKRLKFIADGIMLGGLFTLIYSIGHGFASQDSKYIFLAVTVGLVAVLYLGYHRFVRNTDGLKKRKKPAKK